MENQEIFVCECTSLEHQVAFWYNEEGDELLMYTHLAPEQDILKRVWNAIKYLFGYKCRFGSFDEFVLKVGDVERLRIVLEKLKYNEKFK